MKTLSYKEGEDYQRIIEQPLNVEPTPPLKQLKEYKPEQPQPLPEERRKEEIKKFNEDPKTKINRVMAIKRGTFWFLIILITTLSLVLIINLFWLNTSLASGKMQGNTMVNNTIQVNTPEIPVNVDTNTNNQYNHTINIKNEIEINETLMGDILDDIVDDIIEGVVEGLNETG